MNKPLCIGLLVVSSQISSMDERLGLGLGLSYSDGWLGVGLILEL